MPRLSTRRVSTTAFLVLAAGLGLAGCSSAEVKEVEQSEGAAAPAVTQSATEPVEQSESETVDAEPAQSLDALPEPITDEYWQMTAEADPGAAPETAAVITGLSAETGDGYDRVVVEFTGEGPLGWRASYVEQAVEQGRGETIEVPGQVYLDLNITGTSIPISDEDYAVYYEAGSASAGDVTAVYDSSFEGVSHVVIGMPEARAFDIYMLFDPLRVVVDIER